MTTSTKREAWSENYVQVVEGKERKQEQAGHWKPFALFLCMMQFCTLDDKLVQVFFEIGFCSWWCGYRVGLRLCLVALINLVANRRVPQNAGGWIFRLGWFFTCLLSSEQRQDGLLYWRRKRKERRGRSRLIRKKRYDL